MLSDSVVLRRRRDDGFCARSTNELISRERGQETLVSRSFEHSREGAEDETHLARLMSDPSLSFCHLFELFARRGWISDCGNDREMEGE